MNKFSKNEEFSIPYETKTGTKHCVFHNTSFGRKEVPLKGDVDRLLKYVNKYKPWEQIDRLQTGMCEFCGKINTDIYMHHVKKLKDLTGQSEWVKLMKKKRRKPLAVCFDCHELIHKNIS